MGTGLGMRASLSTKSNLWMILYAERRRRQEGGKVVISLSLSLPFPPSVHDIVPVVSSILMWREGGLSVHWCPPWAWLSAPGDKIQHKLVTHEPTPAQFCRWLVGNFTLNKIQFWGFHFYPSFPWKINKCIHAHTEAQICWLLVSHQPPTWMFCDQIYHHYLYFLDVVTNWISVVMNVMLTNVSTVHYPNESFCKGVWWALTLLASCFVGFFHE